MSIVRNYFLGELPIMSICKRTLDDFDTMCNVNDDDEQEAIKAQLRTPEGKEAVQKRIQDSVLDARATLVDATLQRLNKESAEDFDSD